jgi:hypothetical protein
LAAAVVSSGGEEDMKGSYCRDEHWALTIDSEH